MSRISFVESKIMLLEEAILRINSWKFKNHKIVFTNGCFDILHLGHITYLAKAAQLGDKLIVALNTDLSVKKLEKGSERPINDENARQKVIAALGFVDLVLLFNDNTPLSLIESLKPDVLVKGADYDPMTTDVSDKKYIVGSDFVKNSGGSVVSIGLEEGYSTTNIVNKLRK
jgi:rfaE bifunctional protein nucleotidyltransferase chain/domain